MSKKRRRDEETKRRSGEETAGEPGLVPNALDETPPDGETTETPPDGETTETPPDGETTETPPTPAPVYVSPEETARLERIDAIRDRLAEIGDPYAERSRCNDKWVAARAARATREGEEARRIGALKSAVLRAQADAAPLLNEKADLEKELARLNR